jgi:single stranded DNA-binding protein
MDRNRVEFAGRLTKDPVSRITQGGKRQTFLSIAENRRWTNEAGNKEEVATYADVTFFDQQAEFAIDHLKKGMSVFVDAHITNRVEQVGEVKVHKMGLVGDRLTCLSVLPKKEAAPAEGAQDTRPQAEVVASPVPVSAESGLESAFETAQA